MHRTKLCLGVMMALAAVTLAGERRAEACGGCFQPVQQTVTDITDERMLLAVSGAQSTLYDQIQYSGSPSSFAWVLPIHGVVQVGLSADVLFDSIDELTRTQINPPAQNCPGPRNCSVPATGALEVDAGLALLGPVQVLTQANVGPYATVQLHSTNGTALNDWLASNGYVIPAAAQPILDAYVTEGFDFLAMKLLPDQGIQAMRPVRVTTTGASLTLPLRMASIGTGAVTGITVWIVADGRYEPQNFPFFHIDDSQLVWDFAASISNYTTLWAQQEADAHNATWEIESSIALNENLITSVIDSGGQYYGGGSFATAVSDPSLDYLPIGSADAGTDAGYESAEDVRGADVAALFAGMTGPTVRVTRVRSDIAQTAMTKDFVFQASSDQSELSNVRQVTQSVNLTCPIYNGCTYVGTGTLAQAEAALDAGVADAATSGDATTGGAGGGSGSSGGSGSTSGTSSSAGTPSGGTPSGSSGASTGSSSGTNDETSPPNAHSDSGCSTSPGSAGSGVGFGALAALLGVLLQRTTRRRKSRG